MKDRLTVITVLTLLLSFTGFGLAHAEDAVIQGGVASGAEADSQIQWLWGDVLSVDMPRGEITVRYLDYDNDEERDAIISLDEKTVLENAKSIEDIKPQDTVSIDYKMSPDGRNIARVVSVEKPEAEEAMPPGPSLLAPAEEAQAQVSPPSPTDTTGIPAE